jgi:hypothetical protein
MRLAGRVLICFWALKGMLACSCAPIVSAPACQLVGSSPIVFLGTVGELEGDVYRFRVDRAYKGLADGVKEILIDPDNATSCRAEYRVGKEYLMFATQSHGAGECSGSRPVEWAAKDIEFLDYFARGQTITRVYGKTLQWVDGFGRTREEEQAPAVGALVRLQSKDKSWESVSGPDGNYSFDGLEPGQYTITATSGAVYGLLRRSHEVDVTRGGCSENFIELRTRTEVSGVVLDSRGAAASKMQVELRRRNSDGRWSGTSRFWTYSDQTGRFKFEDIPTGDYLLGHEIATGRPGINSAVPTAYYPGVADEKDAIVVHLEPNQKVQDLKLRLPRPHTPRPITVVVIGADGKPPGDHLLQISANDELVRNIGGLLNAKLPITARAGPITFTGYRERQYRISARY